jgi:L-2-hydroxyglutarate oxidase LhgO
MDADVVIVGAGVIGLAAAAALTRAGRSVIVVERNSGIAQEITARNSNVIHAGIYYPEGSLKAVLCVAGREQLYALCSERNIPHRRLGKLIVAVEPAEVDILETLRSRGSANGVPDLELMAARDVIALEPDVRCEAALHSPASGIVDGHALSLSYLAEAESNGGVLALRTEVAEVALRSGSYRIRARDAHGALGEIECAAVVNAAGLDGAWLAERAGFDLDACGYRLNPCKGDYFSIAPSSGLRISHLIYPVPAEAGLGIHVTLDLSGRLRLGPDTEYVDAPRYDIDPDKGERFARAARRYLPGLERDWLAPDFAGVRPKLAGLGEGFRDFVIREESEVGHPGFVNLIGIESPGLTASPAIAARVVDLLASL